MVSLMKKKTDEILVEVFGCGYDFTGFVPKCVASMLKPPKTSKKPKACKNRRGCRGSAIGSRNRNGVGRSSI